MNTSGSPSTILENTFLPRDNIYICIKKEKTSLVTGNGVSKGAAAHRSGPKDGQPTILRERKVAFRYKDTRIFRGNYL